MYEKLPNWDRYVRYPDESFKTYDYQRIAKVLVFGPCKALSFLWLTSITDLSGIDLFLCITSPGWNSQIQYMIRSCFCLSFFPRRFPETPPFARSNKRKLSIALCFFCVHQWTNFLDWRWVVWTLLKIDRKCEYPSHFELNSSFYKLLEKSRYFNLCFHSYDRVPKGTFEINDFQATWSWNRFKKLPTLICKPWVVFSFILQRYPAWIVKPSFSRL